MPKTFTEEEVRDIINDTYFSDTTKEDFARSFGITLKPRELKVKGRIYGTIKCSDGLDIVRDDATRTSLQKLVETTFSNQQGIWGGTPVEITIKELLN